MLNKRKKEILDKLHLMCAQFVPSQSSAYQYKDIHGSTKDPDTQIDECMEYLMTCIKYTVFDVEACRREIAILRRQNG